MCCSVICSILNVKRCLKYYVLQAGIQSKKLSIVLEPDVVSMICHHELEMLSDLNLKKAGSQYIIIDAGGMYCFPPPKYLNP